MRLVYCNILLRVHVYINVFKLIPEGIVWAKIV